MTKRILVAALFAALGAILQHQASAQGAVAMWWFCGVGHAGANGAGYCAVTASNPMPSTATISGSVTVNTNATATTAPPSYLEGAASPLSQTLTGGLRVQLHIGSSDLSLGGTTESAGIPVALPTDYFGTPSDADWSGSGPGSMIAILKSLYQPLGQFTMSSSLGVTIASDQSPVAVSMPADPFGTEADAAWSGTGSGSMIAILKSLFQPLGQDTRANSLSVTIANDQTPIPTSPSPSSSATVGITPVVSASAEASHVLKASAGNLYSVYATNLTNTAGFLVVLNATSAPGDGAITPLACVPLTANGVASLNYAPGPPAVYATGNTAVVTSATTCFTKTTGVITAFISGSVQ